MKPFSRIFPKLSVYFTIIISSLWMMLYYNRWVYWQERPKQMKRQKIKESITDLPNMENSTQQTWPELTRMLKSLNMNPVLLALTDGGYEDMTMNFYLSSLKPLNINNYVLLTTDIEHYKRLQDQGLNAFYAEDKMNLTMSCNFRSKDCIKKFQFRLEVVLYLVENQFNVLLSDTDLVFLQNPLKYSEQILNDKPATSLSIREDNFDAVCGGFIFFKVSTKSEKILASAINQMIENPAMNDQEALIQEFQKLGNRESLLFYPEKLYMNGERFWGNFDSTLYTHEFATEFMSCANDCHVIHNNYIISFEAKRYRMRENKFWVYDGEDRYYSDPTRLYMTFDNPEMLKTTEKISYQNASEVSFKKEWPALQGALFLAEFLNRTLILPAFKCYDKGLAYDCSLLHRLCVSKFEQSFPNYREHVFLSHPLVPDTVKESKSPVYCFSSQFQTKLKNGPPCQVNVTVGDHNFVHKNEIKTLFENLTYKVLRFSWLYDLKASFDDSNLDVAFEQKLESGFEKCHYMQFNKKT